MTKPLLALPLLLAIHASAHGQAVPMKGARQVLIQTADSAAPALKKLAAAFVAQGYTVDRLDLQFLTLTLAPKALATPFNPIILVHARAVSGANSVLRLSGEYRATVMRHDLNGPLEAKGSEKGVCFSGFQELQKAALTYRGGQVSYAKE